MLLPTPTAQAAKHGLSDRGEGTLDDCNLWTVATRLFPTPTARDHKDGVPCEVVEENGLLGRVAWRLLPTPTAGEGTAGIGLAGEPGERGLNLRTTVDRLLPTPRANADRASRASLTREGHWSAPSLAQAVELAIGELPREYEDWTEVQGWHGATTPPPSPAPPSCSDDQPRLPWTNEDD